MNGNRRTFLAIIALTAILAGPASQAHAEPAAVNSNLAANASFEQCEPGKLPDGWHGDMAVYAGDTQDHHSGTSSLRYVNTAADRYRLCSQKVPVHPGGKYRYGVWVKTKDIRGAESGATVCLEWQDAKGKWLGGDYPHGVKGTHDWSHIEEVTRVPEDAAMVTLACYVRKGMTGTAWFDDVELVRVTDPPMQVIVRAPAYRGWITDEGPEQAQVRVRLDLRDYDLRPNDLRLRTRLHDAHGAVQWESSGQFSTESGNVLDVSIPVGNLAPGSYDLELRLTAGPEGRELQTSHQRLQRLTSDFHPRCRIDEHRRLLVDGKPFFPLGMYFSGIDEADLKTYSASKFNCLLPYQPPTRQQMDLVQRYGLKLIYSLKDFYFGSRFCPDTIRSEADEEPLVRARVRQFRDHPALLAWYLNDELSLKYLARLEAHQRWVSSEDGEHPTWSVIYQVDDVSAYINSFDCIGSDPYPIGRKPASLAAQWTAETFRQVGRSRPVWQVPQAFNWANYGAVDFENRHARTPTFDEERSMAWQCICEGATGLVFYSWSDVKRNPDARFAVQWEALKRIAAEIDGMAPALLSVEPAGAVKVQGVGPSQDLPHWLHWLCRQHGGKLYVFAANDGDGAGAIQFSLPGPPGSVNVVGENRSVSASGTVFRDDFKKLAVHIYEIDYSSLPAFACRPDFFPIVTWDRRDAWKSARRPGDGGLQSAADCRFTVAGFVRPEDVPLCEKLGLAAIVAPSEPGKPWFRDWKKLSDDDIDRGIRLMVEKSGNGKAVIGYTIMDEPGTAAFPKLAKAVAAVKKYAPGKLAHINLYPNYATLGARDTSQIGAPTYHEYLERFVAEVHPQFLCYDNYMVEFSDDLKDAGKAALYYTNLLDARRVAREHHLPLWNVVCCNQVRKVTPIPSPANLAFQAYTALAAGVQGITWFKYHQDTYAYAPIDRDNRKSETWSYLQVVNHEIGTLGPIMNLLDSTGVYFTSPPAKSLPLLPGRIVKQVQSRTSLRGTGRAESPPVMVGEFLDGHGADYVMLVNLDLGQSVNIRLETVRPYKSRQVYSAQDGRLSPLDEQNGQWLVAGEGILVKLE